MSASDPAFSSRSPLCYEAELRKLQATIEEERKRKRYSEVRQRSEEEEEKSMKVQNKSEIKQLNMQIEELNARIKQCQQDSKRLLSSSLDNYSKLSISQRLGDLSKKSEKEAMQSVDAKILSLQNKNKELNQLLHISKRKLKSDEEVYKEMCLECKEVFENEPTEQDNIEHIRELEAALRRVEKNSVDSETAQAKLKVIKGQLEKNKSSYPLLLLEVEKEFRELEKSMDNLEPANDEENNQKSVVVEKSFEKFPKEKQKQYTSEKTTYFQKPSEEISCNSSAENNFGEQNAELKKLLEAFEQIRLTTGVYDVQDAEFRLLLQKAMQEDLLYLKGKASKHLQELRDEKKDLQSKLQLMRGTAACPKTKLEGDLRFATSQNEGQKMRKDTAQKDVQKLRLIDGDVKEKLLNLKSKIKKYFYDEIEPFNPSASSGDLAEEIEKILAQNFREFKIDISYITERNRVAKAFRRRSGK